MAMTISTAFIKQFEADVHLAYQRMGSKLRNTVRTKTGVRGTSTTFQKIGKGEASTKGRHAEVTPMNLVHTNVECTLADYYASEYIDKLDELKINIAERQAVAQSAAAALGRKTDSLIDTSLNTTTNTTAAGAAGMTKAKVYTSFEAMGDRDVPDDGNRFLVVGSEQWTELLDITEFASADYVDTDDLPFKGGMTAKRWLGFIVFWHSGLTKSGSDRSTFMYHRSAVGAAWGADVMTEINYVPEKVAHLSTSMMSLGTCMIDDNGVQEIVCTET